MIKVENLTKSYDDVLAIKDLNFEIKKGEIVGFLGPNGAGKTTTMNILTCYLSPTSGSAWVAGFDIKEQSLEAKKKVGYLPEDNPLYEEMTVFEYLNFVAKMREISGQKKMKRIKEVADICGLKDVISKDIGQLSHGYRQRVGFAQSIFHNPDILILDEPTSGLDPNQTREIRQLIRKLKTEKTVILSTHILSEAQAVSDRVMIINKGIIVADGTKEELEKMVQGKEKIYIKLEVPPEEAINSLVSLEGVENVKERDRENEHIIGYEIETKKGTDIRKSLHRFIVNKGWQMLELHREIVSLEDIFSQLTEDNVSSESY
jgi:ABC-2 type transport system ATP-binding protein